MNNQNKFDFPWSCDSYHHGTVTLNYWLFGLVSPHFKKKVLLQYIYSVHVCVDAYVYFNLSNMDVIFFEKFFINFTILLKEFGGCFGFYKAKAENGHIR